MTLNIKRRIFLKTSLAVGLTGGAAAFALLTPRAVLATWDEKAFDSRSVSDALQNGLGSSAIAISDDILIKAPDIAANGAIVQVTVEAKLPDVESITLLAEKNPRPLCGIFHPGPGVRPKMAIRIKMGQSSDVIAVAKSGGKLYMARRSVKVSAGGCS
ncbi:MAG: thiosulfate oxidation carrier protein SoxY [gamma proteobacterium endosymbiont of Lamellibrachia anaximandri]|nr:thiosulfate oxidation carrier protein SoxY [gamma proteobacterium endosymbiont of Lamellibrachia anaximandri]